jgi:hypothetical protein
MGLFYIKKQKNLLKLWAKKSSVQIMDGLTGGKKQENIVYKRMHGAEKSADFLAADEWIKREWPKIIVKYSPKDT